MIAHRTADRAVSGRAWADRIRATAAWSALGWAATMAVHLAGLVIVRMPSWAAGFTILSSFVPDGSSASALGGLPVFVPVLIGLGLIEHAAVVLPRPTIGWGETAAAVAKGFGYAVLIALLVCFGPGVGQSFIYIQF